MKVKYIILGIALMGVVTGAAFFTSQSCYSNGILPDQKCTPGAINPSITQANISQNICNPLWSTKSIRPPEWYTTPLKMRQIKQYGYADINPSHYEEDHLISLEIGGSPTDPRNLWPEPYSGTEGARMKDQVENNCHKLVCTGKMTLAQAQAEISTNWTWACK